MCVELSYPDLLAVAQELLNARDVRPLMGVKAISTRNGSAVKVAAIRAPDGSPLPARPTYRLALNSYDSQSGGGRFPVLAKMVADPANHRALHAVQIRDALIDFFVTRQEVGRGSLLV